MSCKCCDGSISQTKQKGYTWKADKKAMASKTESSIQCIVCAGHLNPNRSTAQQRPPNWVSLQRDGQWRSPPRIVWYFPGRARWQQQLEGDTNASVATGQQVWEWWEGINTVGANRAAFSVGNLWIGAVVDVLADHLVAHDCSTVADANPAWLRFPYILIVVRLAF